MDGNIKALKRGAAKALVRGFGIAGVFLLGQTGLLAHGEYAWIQDGGYRSPVSNEWCCGANDCFKVEAEKVHTDATGYVIEGLNETVPYSETLVSQDGKFWRCQRPDGSRRCFFAPSQGS